jgi:hypothetical protein
MSRSRGFLAYRRKLAATISARERGAGIDPNDAASQWLADAERSGRGRSASPRYHSRERLDGLDPHDAAGRWLREHDLSGRT